jgi:5'-deoxynucleotidase YfbR-like HD superfamily hydrolase
MVDNDRLLEVVRDSLVQKRVVKWGYVRRFGGPHAAACDSVAAHTGAVATLAVILASECRQDLKEKTGADLDLGDVALLGLFHDLGECRSGDTGAAGHGISGTCNLYALEREGLASVMDQLVLAPRILALFDDYRAYRTPESIIVHIADNIEGFEKGLEISGGRGESADMAFAILRENVTLYHRRHEVIPTLGPVCKFAVSELLQPAITGIVKAYGLDPRTLRGVFDERRLAAAE